MFLRVDISNLVPAVFSDTVAILTAPAVDNQSLIRVCVGMIEVMKDTSCMLGIQ